jgi:hypothetical protein
VLFSFIFSIPSLFLAISFYFLFFHLFFLLLFFHLIIFILFHSLRFSLFYACFHSFFLQFFILYLLMPSSVSCLLPLFLSRFVSFGYPPFILLLLIFYLPSLFFFFLFHSDSWCSNALHIIEAFFNVSRNDQYPSSGNFGCKKVDSPNSKEASTHCVGSLVFLTNPSLITVFKSNVW